MDSGFELAFNHMLKHSDTACKTVVTSQKKKKTVGEVTQEQLEMEGGSPSADFNRILTQIVYFR